LGIGCKVELEIRMTMMSPTRRDEFTQTFGHEDLNQSTDSYLGSLLG